VKGTQGGKGRDRDEGVLRFQVPLLKKEYYSIGEVCELAGLKPHVLRYWETQFKALQPTKNRAGNRVYRPKEVELVLFVKHLLYEEKYTIEGADRRIRELRKGGGLSEQRREAVQPEILAAIREELERLHALLELPDEQSAATGGGQD
jgi:DNA-binding transcriptional MerR regulator